MEHTENEKQTRLRYALYRDESHPLKNPDSSNPKPFPPNLKPYSLKHQDQDDFHKDELREFFGFNIVARLA